MATKKNIMLIEMAKRFTIGDIVENLDVVITTAGGPKQVDETLPKKQSNQEWFQKIGVTDTSGHIWATLDITSGSNFIPMIKGRSLIIREAEIDEFTNKGGSQEKLLRIRKYEILTGDVGEPEKPKFEGVIDPLIERILEKYDIAATDALWPCTRTAKGVAKTTWVIYHRYCEQIAAKAGIVFQDPELIVNEVDSDGKRTVVLLVRGQLGYVKEWSYGEASPQTTFLPYVFAMAEKRAKDRVILKLAGFHGMVYSDVEMED